MSINNHYKVYGVNLVWREQQWSNGIWVNRHLFFRLMLLLQRVVGQAPVAILLNDIQVIPIFRLMNNTIHHNQNLLELKAIKNSVGLNLVKEDILRNKGVTTDERREKVNICKEDRYKEVALILDLLVIILMLKNEEEVAGDTIIDSPLISTRQVNQVVIIKVERDININFLTFIVIYLCKIF